jgi:hypothetical protein
MEDVAIFSIPGLVERLPFCTVDADFAVLVISLDEAFGVARAAGHTDVAPGFSTFLIVLACFALAREEAEWGVFPWVEEEPEPDVDRDEVVRALTDDEGRQVLDELEARDGDNLRSGEVGTDLARLIPWSDSLDLSPVDIFRTPWMTLAFG